MNRHLITATVLILLGALCSACGAPQAPPPPDVRVLMRTGRYGEAVAEAERRASGSERNTQVLALLAAARAAEAAPQGSTETAGNALLQAVAASNRAEAALAFTTEVTGSMAFTSNRFTTAAQTMMALAQGWQGDRDNAEARAGAAAILALAAYGGEQQAPVAALVPLIQAGITLIETSTNDMIFPDDDMHNAWECFRATGNLAATTASSGENQLSALASEAAIRIAESNPQLAIPIACDIGSPRNQLRESLRRRHDADSLGRLSAAMADAEGCSLGTYAP